MEIISILNIVSSSINSFLVYLQLRQHKSEPKQKNKTSISEMPDDYSPVGSSLSQEFLDRISGEDIKKSERATRGFYR